MSMKLFFKYFTLTLVLFLMFENSIASSLPEVFIEKMKKKGWYRVSTFCDISGDISPDQAREKAFNQAMRMAIEVHTGVNVKSDITTFSSSSDNLKRFTQWTSTASQGIILEQNIISEGMENHGDDFFVYQIRCELKVGKQDGKRDPNFVIDAEINKPMFIHGQDKFFLSVEASKNCYLYIFSIRSDDSVEFMMPNPHQSDNFVEKEKIFTFPNRRYSIYPKLYEGKESDTEIIKIIALKKESDGFKFLFKENTFSRFKLMKALVDIPLSDIAEFDLTYSIKREK